MSREVKIPKQVKAMIEAGGAVPPAEPAVVPVNPPAEAVPPAAAVIPEAIPAAEPPAGHDARLSHEQILKLPHDVLAQKYSTLQGKYHAEVIPLTQRIKDLQAENEQLKLRGPVVSGKPLAEDIDEDLRNEVGPEVVQVVQKAVDQVRTEMAEREGKLRFAHFVEMMETAVSDFRKHNDDPEFIAWLAESEGLSGAPRNAGFQRAVADLNARAAAKYFHAWIASKQKPASRIDETVIPEPTGGAGALPEDKPKVKETFIAQFNSDVVKGRYRNNPAEKKRIETMIDAAVREGRVIKG